MLIVRAQKAAVKGRNAKTDGDDRESASNNWTVTSRMIMSLMKTSTNEDNVEDGDIKR